jgi:hypothetical protein
MSSSEPDQSSQSGPAQHGAQQLRVPQPTLSNLSGDKCNHGGEGCNKNQELANSERLASGQVSLGVGQQLKLAPTAALNPDHAKAVRASDSDEDTGEPEHEYTANVSCMIIL